MPEGRVNPVKNFFFLPHEKPPFFPPKSCSFPPGFGKLPNRRAFVRRRYLQRRHFYTRLDLDGAEDMADSRQGREEGELWTCMVGKATIGGLLDTLTQDQRNTLMLYFFEGYAFVEIAEKLNQSLGNIRNHYYRGLEKLRKQMFPGKLPGGNGYGRK